MLTYTYNPIFFRMKTITPKQIQEAKDYCRLCDDRAGVIITKTDKGNLMSLTCYPYRALLY
jgi:hypothetical protein